MGCSAAPNAPLLPRRLGEIVKKALVKGRDRSAVASGPFTLKMTERWLLLELKWARLSGTLTLGGGGD